MTKLNKKTLIEITKLCRINCSDNELEILHENLKSILNYIDHMNEVDTEGVEVCDHVSKTASNVFREDLTGETLSREIFLKNSPAHVGGMIRVPNVIKKGS